MYNCDSVPIYLRISMSCVIKDCMGDPCDEMAASGIPVLRARSSLMTQLGYENLGRHSLVSENGYLGLV